MTSEEKKLFGKSLQESGLSEDVFGFYEALARLSTEKVRWVFIKAFARQELLGLGIFARVQGLNASQLLRSELRARPWLQHVGKLFRPRMYFSVHNLCSSLSTPFLCQDHNRQATVVASILSWLKQSGHFESQALHHYSRKFLARRVFGWSYPFSASYQLHELESDAREKRQKALENRVVCNG